MHVPKDAKTGTERGREKGETRGGTDSDTGQHVSTGCLDGSPSATLAVLGLLIGQYRVRMGSHGRYPKRYTLRFTSQTLGFTRPETFASHVGRITIYRTADKPGA